MTPMGGPLRPGGTVPDMGDHMGDADELRIMADTMGPMNKHLAARLLVIAARIEDTDRTVRALSASAWTERTPEPAALCESGEPEEG